MGQLETAMANVKTAISKTRSKNKSSYEETIGQVSSYLVFLRSTVLSKEAANKLSKCLRERLAHIYGAFPQQGIELAAALCKTLYETKILTEFTAGNQEQKLLWDNVMNALLSGVLDFYDEKPDAKRKEVIGVVLYPTLCSTFFSISISHMSVDLRCTGYTLLSETADAHKTNQTRLQDISILGGSRLGSILWRTREFLVLESVLNLFARMIPSTGGTPAGKAARTAFIRSVFVESSPDCAETGEKLARLLEKVRTADWDHTATQILDVLASSNIAFPQPFEVTDATTCDKAKTVDRLYVDEKGFIGNILLDEDTCDSLSISYDTVTAIQVLSKSTTKRQENPQVTLFLSIPPIIGKDPITPPCTSEQPSGDPTVTFRLLKIDLVRFQQAMKSRGMEHLVAVDRGAKSSILASPAKLEMDSAGQLIEDMQLAQRIENLSQLYGTNDPSDGSPKGTEPIPGSASGAPTLPLTHDAQKQETGSDHSTCHKAANHGENLDRTAGNSPLQRDSSTGNNLNLCMTSGSVAATAARPDSSSAPKAITHTSVSLRHTKSQAVLEAAFGTSDDELSDIEDAAKPRDPPESAQSDDKRLATSAHLASRSRKVLGSDDDIPSTPVRPPVRKTVKKLVIVSDDEDEIEEVLPASKLSSSIISRRRSTMNLAPVNKDLSASSVRKLSTTVVISMEDPRRDEDVMDLEDSKLGGEVVLRKEASDLAGLVPNTILASTASRTPESGARSNDKAARDVPTKPTKGKSSRICDDESKPSMSSSPVRLQAARKSVKSALRNKKGTAADAPQPPSHVKQSKRRRELNASVDGGNDGDSGSEDGDARSGPRKRSKATQNEVETAVRTTSGPTPAIKRYGGRKGRTSSPAIANHPSVNYDSIPKTPPALVFEKSSVLPAKDTKPIPQNTKVVALLEKKRGKPRPVRKAKANTDPVVVQSSNVPLEQPRTDERVTRSKRATAAKEVVNVSSPENSETKVTNGALASNKKNLQAVLADPIREQDCFVAGLETEDGTHMSTPRLQEKPRRKSNRKPWNALPAAAPVIKEQDAGASEARINTPDASMVASENNEAGSVHDQPSDVAEYEDTTMVEEDVEHPVLNKSLAERERNVTLKEHLVDLTEDSPVKQASALLNVEKQSWLARLSKEHFADADEDASPRPPRVKPSVTFAQAPMRIQETITKSTPPPKSRSKAAGVTRTAGDNLFKREIIVPTATTKARVRPPSIENIAKVLDEIQEAILHKIHSNVEGVREEVRLGRERLMADASADLMRMRAESITRYNLLIELEAEYATFGRNVAYGLDDLVQVNHKIESEIKKIIQDHNRGGISKKAPTSLFSATLPASIMAFKA